MDSPNTGPVSPDPKPHHHDIAEPGPIDPATGQPDRHAEVSAVKSWFRENLVSLVITAVVVGLVFAYLDPLDTLKVVLGLGLVIFIHELGHFLAAKWCDVHVKTFSIGFGPAVPFCSYKWGETTYMLGIIPLGGYVSMVGEGTGEGTGAEPDPDDEDDDPRSFKNKSVGKRLLIISAGVVMNVILGMACFMAVYLHGVREEPATAGTVGSGSAAWRSGMRTGDDITRIESRDNPTFKDIRPIVMTSDEGEELSLLIDRDGHKVELRAEPLREEGSYFPTLGITAPYQLTLIDFKKRKGVRPVLPGTPAAAAEPRFEPGDRFVAMSDPDRPGNAVTDLKLDREGNPNFEDYYKRMVRLAGQPVTIVVARKNSGGRVEIPVGPSFRSDLGVRMQMGKVAAVRRGGPADGKIQPVAVGAPPTSPGDRIKAVKLPPGPDGRQTWYVAGPPELDWTKKEFQTPDPKKIDVRPLDPVLLPLQLTRWSDANPSSRTVRLVVLRQQEHKEDDPVEVALEFDPSFRFDREVVTLPNSPLPVSGLGLAFWVEGTVTDVAAGSPAAGKLRPGDQVTAVRFKTQDADGNVKAGEWEEEIKPHQWAFVETGFQSRPPHQLDLRVNRDGQTVEVELAGRPDPAWPTDDRGFVFQMEARTHQAADIGDAVNLGWRRTTRFIKDVYAQLYGMIRGRISAKTMSGPLTIATVSYRFAGEDFWQFLLFLGLISVNLAVVNFLPIPVLDGGHAVFLILEKILGRPVPERIFAMAMYTGLFLILSLMIFVVVLDVRRIFFGWF